MNGIRDGSLFRTSIITTDPERIFRWARTPPVDDRLSPAVSERSWRFHRSAGSITGTSGSRPEHRWVPFEGSRVAMKTPPGLPWTRRTFCRAESLADGRQTNPNAVSGKHFASLAEKRVTVGDEGSVGGPDEIKRRDNRSMGRSFITDRFTGPNPVFAAVSGGGW